MAVAAFDAGGNLLDATGLQIPGVLDDLYARRRPAQPWPGLEREPADPGAVGADRAGSLGQPLRRRRRLRPDRHRAVARHR